MRFFSIIARRVFYALALLLAVIIFNFILLSMVPGDIAETIAGESGGASAEVMAEIEQAVTEAKAAARPTAEQVTEDVYIQYTATA